jgi:hypothetical protein
MTARERAEIRKAANAADPGPWRDTVLKLSDAYEELLAERNRFCMALMDYAEPSNWEQHSLRCAEAPCDLWDPVGGDGEEHGYTRAQAALEACAPAAGEGG